MSLNWINTSNLPSSGGRHRRQHAANNKEILTCRVRRRPALPAWPGRLSVQILTDQDRLGVIWSPSGSKAARSLGTYSAAPVRQFAIRDAVTNMTPAGAHLILKALILGDRP